jgi:hypothetical protein
VNRICDENSIKIACTSHILARSRPAAMTGFLIHRHPQNGLNVMSPAGTAFAPTEHNLSAPTTDTPKVDE